MKELISFFSQSYQIKPSKGECLHALWAAKDLQIAREGTTREATAAGQQVQIHVAHRGQTCDRSAGRTACFADRPSMPAGEAHGQDQRAPGPTQDLCDPVAGRIQSTHVAPFRGQTCETGEPVKTRGAISDRRPACIAAGTAMSTDAARRQDQQGAGIPQDHGVPGLARKQVTHVAHVWAATCEPVATKADCADDGNVEMFCVAHGQDAQESGHLLEHSVPFAAHKQKTHVAHVRATTCTLGDGLPTHLRPANDCGTGHDTDDEAEEEADTCSHRGGTAAAGSQGLDACFWSTMDSETRLRTPPSGGRKLTCIADGAAPISRGAHGQAQLGPRHPAGHRVPVAAQKQETHVAHFRAATCIPAAGPPLRPSLAYPRRSGDAAADHAHHELHQNGATARSDAHRAF